jgi:hypothetical protein
MQQECDWRVHDSVYSRHDDTLKVLSAQEKLVTKGLAAIV